MPATADASAADGKTRARVEDALPAAEPLAKRQRRKTARAREASEPPEPPARPPARRARTGRPQGKGKARGDAPKAGPKAATKAAPKGGPRVRGCGDESTRSRSHFDVTNRQELWASRNGTTVLKQQSFVERCQILVEEVSQQVSAGACERLDWTSIAKAVRRRSQNRVHWLPSTAHRVWRHVAYGAPRPPEQLLQGSQAAAPSGSDPFDEENYSGDASDCDDFVCDCDEFVTDDAYFFRNLEEGEGGEGAPAGGEPSGAFLCSTPSWRELGPMTDAQRAAMERADVFEHDFLSGCEDGAPAVLLDAHSLGRGPPGMADLRRQNLERPFVLNDKLKETPNRSNFHFSAAPQDADTFLVGGVRRTEYTLLETITAAGDRERARRYQRKKEPKKKEYKRKEYNAMEQTKPPRRPKPPRSAEQIFADDYRKQLRESRAAADAAAPKAPRAEVRKAIEERWAAIGEAARADYERRAAEHKSSFAQRLKVFEERLKLYESVHGPLPVEEPKRPRKAKAEKAPAEAKADEGEEKGREKDREKDTRPLKVPDKLSSPDRRPLPPPAPAAPAKDDRPLPKKATAKKEQPLPRPPPPPRPVAVAGDAAAAARGARPAAAAGPAPKGEKRPRAEEAADAAAAAAEHAQRRMRAAPPPPQAVAQPMAVPSVPSVPSVSGAAPAAAAAAGIVHSMMYPQAPQDPMTAAAALFLKAQMTAHMAQRIERGGEPFRYFPQRQ